jgi:hypothetical protein
MTARLAARLSNTVLGSLACAGALAAALSACDEVYANPVTDPGTSSFSGAPDAGGLTSPRTPPASCTRSPAENAPCNAVGAICEVGTSPDKECNAIYVCANDLTYGSHWTEESFGSCAQTCPPSSEIVDGAPCELDGGAEAELHCTTPLGTCACTTGPDGAHAHARMWVCVKPADVTCPESRPLLGQPCFGERTCDYGSCAFKRGFRMICEDDVWQTEGAPCAD